jgi:cytochrome c556
MKLWSYIFSFIAVAALSLAVPALAQDKAALVKERGGIMKNVSGTLKALDKSAKSGKVGANDAARASKALASYKKYTSLFPAGTDSGVIKTRAKPEIWKDWSKFEAQAGKLVTALTDVEKAAKAGDAAALGAAVKTAQGTCGGCHKPFRGPKPK